MYYQSQEQRRSPRGGAERHEPMNKLQDKHAQDKAAPMDAVPVTQRVHKRTLALGAVLVAAISYIALYVDLVVNTPHGVKIKD